MSQKIQPKTKLRLCAFGLLTSLSMLFTPFLQANNDFYVYPPPPPPEETAKQKPAGTVEQKFIRTNIAVAEWFDGIAEGLDLFLVDQKLTNKKNETSVRLENTATLREGEGVSSQPSVNANLRLPNFEQYWNLKFTSYDERRERRSAQRTQLRQRPVERNYGASVGLFRKLGNVRTAFQPRVELQDPLKVSHSLSFESVAEYETYQINPKLEFFAQPERGTGFFVGLNFNYELSRYYNLTLVNQGEYEDKPHLLTVTHGMSLGQMLSDKMALSYSFYTSTLNKPNYSLDSYSPGIGFNHLIYRNILDYSISPHMLFTRERNFRGQGALSFTVNLNF